MKLGATSLLTSLMARSSALTRLNDSRARRFAYLLAASGTIGNPSELAATSTANSIFAALVLVPIAAVLGAFFWLPLALLSAFPIAVYFYPVVRLRSKSAERREKVEKELPLFSVLVNVLGGAGLTLQEILDSTIGTGIFPSIEKEARVVGRDVRIFGMNSNDALERLAARHPSHKLVDFINGYTSKVRSGGDLPSFLLSQSGSLLREMEEAWTRYTARIGVVGSMMITVFGVVPLLLLVVGAFSAGYSIVGLLLYTGIGVPLFTILIVWMAGRMQPVGVEQPRGKPFSSLLLSLPAALAGLLSREAWVGVSSVLLAFFILYGISVREDIAETRQQEDALPSFAKDMMEYKRQEYDLTRAVVRAARENRYGDAFDGVMSRVSSKLQAGVPLDEVRVESRSPMVRMVFFLLGQMGKSGGGTVETMYHLASYSERMVGMKNSTRAEMKPYLVLSYVSPLLLAFGVTFVQGVLGSFTRTGGSALTLPLGQVGAPTELMGQVAALLIVVSAAALGLIGAKMMDFTIRNTLRSSLNLLLAVAAIASVAALNFSALL